MEKYVAALLTGNLKLAAAVNKLIPENKENKKSEFWEEVQRQLDPKPENMFFDPKDVVVKK